MPNIKLKYLVVAIRAELRGGGWYRVLAERSLPNEFGIKLADRNWLAGV